MISEKPYIEHPDSDDRPDSVLANIWWDNHLRREMSVIQTLFTGQFKSVMSCASCNHTSARFEPFNFLTLPLPEDEERLLSVHVVPRNSKSAIFCSVIVKKFESLETVCEIIRSYNLCSSHNSLFVVLELSMSKLVNIHSTSKRIDTVRDGDCLFFYEVESTMAKFRKPLIHKFRFPNARQA
jgi:ubiquitin carboxyl-terminal hydrolase 6/32